MYKLVALDIDDTIINIRNNISEKTRSAIMRAQKKGVKVTLASGRMYQSMINLAGHLDIKMPLISCNGAMIKSPDKTIYCQLLDNDTAKKAIDYFAEKNKALQIYKPDGLYSKEKCERTWFLEQSEGLPCNMIDEQAYDRFYKEDILKLLIRLQPEEVDFFRADIAEKFSGVLSYALSHKVYIEMTQLGINKGRALSHLAKLYGIKQNEVLAIGDSPNDKRMLEWAGLGIAMGNAMDEVKNSADTVTDTIENDGVAKALEEYVL